MSKSLRNDRRFADDYQYEDERASKQSKKMLRRQDKRQARELPCEREG